MKIVVLGLSLSSSWGNGHATTFRSLLQILGQRHKVVFLEREQPWYAANRDLPAPDFCRLEFYDSVNALSSFREDIEAADAVILGSYVPDGVAVARRVHPWVRGVFCFYDIDTPVTLGKLLAGDEAYISRKIIPLFDIYFSFTGGPTLGRLREQFGARDAVELYCSVDERRYKPIPVARRWDLGYLGTYSPDRQPALERLLLEPARRAPERKFVIAGPMYPALDWPENVERIEHLPPDQHPAFYSAQAWTLNITRADMIAAGHSPSVRLFEASACGVPIISDAWPGLDSIFRPAKEIVVAESGADVLRTLAMPEADRARIAAAGRARCLAGHTATHRAGAFERAIAHQISAMTTNAKFAGALP